MPGNNPTTEDLRQQLQSLREEHERLKADHEKARASHDGQPDGGHDGNRDGKPADKPPKPPLPRRLGGYVRTHPIKSMAGLVLLVALVIGGFLYWRYRESYESTDDAQIDAHLNPITPRIAGTVTRVYVDDNQFVRAGDPLVDLDLRDYETALAQAEGAYRRAQAEVQAENPNVPITRTSTVGSIATATSNVSAAAAGVAAAEQEHAARLAGLRQAEAEDVKAQRDVTRMAPLAQKEEISQQQFDAYVATARSTAAAVQAAKAAVDAARKVVDQRRAQLAQAQTALRESSENAPRQVAIQRQNVATRQAAAAAVKAQLEQARLNLGYTRIVAPVSGIVNRRTVEVGERVQPGEDLLSISQIDDIWVTANFKETQLKRMRAGQAVDIHTDAFGTTYRGYVESMPGASGAKLSLLPPEKATGNYVMVVQRLPVRIRLNPGQDPERRLRPGMSVEPKVWLNSSSNSASAANNPPVPSAVP